MTTFPLLTSILVLLAAESFAATNPAARSPEQILACSARTFVASANEALIETRYLLNASAAERQLAVTSTVDGTVSNSSISGSRTDVVGEAKISKTLYNHALNQTVEARQKDLQAQQADLRARLFEFLIAVNRTTEDVLGLMTERAAVIEQIKELEDLDQFAKGLAHSRVIDLSDALLVEENLNRFRLQQLETERSIVALRKDLESKTGLAIDELDLPSSARTKSILGANAWTQLEAKIPALPAVKRSEIRLQAISNDRLATDRWWIPTLSGNLGVDQTVTNTAASSTTVSELKPFVGLTLQISFGSDLIDAKSERLSALERLENERSRRASFEYQNRLLSIKEAWSLIQSQVELAASRKANLERLRRLQLAKFRAGRLSFLNLNDVMLSLLDARKQVFRLSLALARVEREARLYAQIATPSEEFFGGCKRPLANERE